MSARPGPAAAVAVIGAAAGVAAILMLLKPPVETEALSLQTAQDCHSCHAAVYAEWEASHHAYAYLNPEVRKLSQDFRNEECLACHAPRPVLSFQAGERVLARSSDRGAGVDCMSCHLRPQGGIATSNPRPSSSAPCQPVYEPRLAGVDMCASCHNQHQTVDQWRASDAEIRGDNCLGCHMEDAFRAGGRRGRHHGFPAGHDRDALLKAVTLTSGSDADGRPWVELHNVGAGHNFPTDERSRAADLQLRWQDEAGAWQAWQRLHRFRDPYRDETDLTNTQLPSQQVWRKVLDPPAPGRAGEVRLLYRTQPFLPDADSVEMYRVGWPQ